MKRVLILVAVAAVVALGFGAQPASAYDDGPSASVDPGQLVTYPTALAGLGDTLPTFDPTDVAIAGIPDKDVGIDAASADILADPPPGSLVVDDDGVQCKNATYQSISDAVANSVPGDTIKVCPGVYEETVLVPWTLTFRGSTKVSNARCAKPVIPDPTKDSIVHYPFSGTSGDNAGSPGFNVQANGVLIAGFLIEPLIGTGGPAMDGDGIWSSPLFSGTVVRENILQHNSRGVRLHSNGTTQSVVRKNCVRDNNFGPPNTLTGQGIYLAAPASNFLIDHNYTTQNLDDPVGSGAGMNLFFATDVTIRDNRSVADSSAVAIFDSSSIDIRHNKATDATGSTFFFGGGNSDLHIISNHLKDGDFSGIRFSSLNFGGGVGPSTMVEVRDNQIEHMGASGIRAGVTGPALTSSTLAKNHSHDNAMDGIRIETDNNLDATPNTITQNKLKHNGGYDCYDNTSGTRTAGTANFWTNNEGDTQNRPGLCKHASTP
jgi:parallel beta helix pectate lyase-like protein